jgi:hypothetical protein
LPPLVCGTPEIDTLCDALYVSIDRCMQGGA